MQSMVKSLIKLIEELDKVNLQRIDKCNIVLFVVRYFFLIKIIYNKKSSIGCI